MAFANHPKGLNTAAGRRIPKAIHYTPPKKKKATGVTVPSAPSPYLTDAQILAKAQALANQLIAPSRIQLQQQMNARTAQNAGVTEAIGKLLQQVAPNIQGIYSNAGQELQGLGQGFQNSTLAQQASEEGKVGNLLAQNGASSQQGMVDNNIGGPALPNAQYGLSTFLPGRQLATQGAAAAAEAAKLPPLGAEVAASRLSDLLAPLQSSMNDLLTKRPDLVQQLVSQYTNQRTQRQQFDISQKQNALKFAYQQYQDNMANAFKKRYLLIAQGRADLANRQYQLDVQKATNQYNVSVARLKQGAVRLNQGQQRIDNATAAAANKPNPNIKAGRQARAGVFKDALAFLNSHPHFGTKKFVKGNPGIQQQLFHQIYEALLVKYRGIVPDAQLNAWIRAALRQPRTKTKNTGIG